MSEIIFDKSKRNLRMVYDRLQSVSEVDKAVGMNGVLFCAIGGYNRTYELIRMMGVAEHQISTHSSLNLSADFLNATHGKKVVYIRKINYITKAIKATDFSKRQLELNVADGFEESMMLYKYAQRKVGQKASPDNWLKPSVVILDDQTLNLQFGGHRFYNHNEIGFVQIRNRNADPAKIIDEIKSVEPANYMMFVRYQEREADESGVLDSLNKLREAVHRHVGTDWYMKPTEFKKVVGSNDLANALKEIPELGITQFKSNKKLGRENARWIVIPESSFEFKGFDYMDDEDIFKAELEEEERTEEQIAIQKEQAFNRIMTEEFPLNVRIGYASAELGNAGSESLQSFVSATDGLTEETGVLELLESATTKVEYDNLKKYHLAYFIDGHFKDDYRNDDNYEGGKRLITIDVDDGHYTRQQLEEKLEAQDLFGIIYPSARYYFDGSERWRIILMADKEMTKDEYRHTVTGLTQMIGLEADEASKKISQLMGYPLKEADVSTVFGTMVNVDQFKPKEQPKNLDNIIEFKESEKSLVDFDHQQAKLLREALTSGIPQGRRNDSYYQIMQYLNDTLSKEKLKHWHKEAEELKQKVIDRMYADGLGEKEVKQICRL